MTGGGGRVDDIVLSLGLLGRLPHGCQAIRISVSIPTPISIWALGI